MNFGELRAAVKDRLAVPAAGDSLITDAWANGAINTALSVVSSEKPWWWLLTDITFQFNGGQAAMPADLMKVEAIQAYGGLIEPVARRDMLDQAMAPLVMFGWTVIGSTLWLVPAPDGLIPARMLYYRSEPALVNDTDVPVMPAVFHPKLVAYATYLGYQRRQDSTRAAPLFADYKDWVSRTLADQSPVKGPRRVRTPRRTFVGPGLATLPAQPAISTGGVIDCTSTTRPLAVDGQVIFETDKRRLLQYEAAITDWVPPRGVGFTAPAASGPAQSYDGELWFQGDTRKTFVRDTANGVWLPLYGLVHPCTAATRPTIGVLDGQAIFETDTRRLLTWSTASGAWKPLLGAIYVCTAATLPAAPVEGQAVYQTDTHALLMYTTATTLWRAPWNLPWGLLASGQLTSTANFTTLADSGVSATVTVPANRRVKVRAYCQRVANNSTASMAAWLYVREGSTILGRAYIFEGPAVPSGGGTAGFVETPVLTPSAGAHTYKLSAERNGGSDTHMLIGTTDGPLTLEVLDLGPAGAPA